MSCVVIDSSTVSPRLTPGPGVETSSYLKGDSLSRKKSHLAKTTESQNYCLASGGTRAASSVGVPTKAGPPPEDIIAIRRLSQQLRPSLIGFFRRRLSDGSEAEDLTQEVFLRLLRRRGIAKIEDLHGYAFETASNVLTDWARRRTVRRANTHESFDYTRHGGQEMGSDRVVIARQALSHLCEALFGLSKRGREVFLLRRLDGLAYRDIAGRMGISISAVEKYMVRNTAYVLHWTENRPAAHSPGARGTRKRFVMRKRRMTESQQVSTSSSSVT